MNLSTSRASRQMVESSLMEVRPSVVTHTTGLPKVGKDGVLGDDLSRAPCFSVEPLPIMECNSYEDDGR